MKFDSFVSSAVHSFYMNIQLFNVRIFPKKKYLFLRYSIYLFKEFTTYLRDKLFKTFVFFEILIKIH